MSPALLISIPLLGAFLLFVMPEKRGLITAVLTPVALFTLTLSILTIIRLGEPSSFNMGGWPPPFGINLVMDSLSSFFVLTIQLGFFLAIFGLVGWYRPSRYTGALLLTTLAAVNGMVLTGDLFNLFVFMEIASVSLFALLNVRETSGSLRVTFNYMVLSVLASSVYLIGIAMVYSATGTLNMANLSQNFFSLQKPGAMVMIMLLTPLLLKSEIFPLNLWAPHVYSRASAGITTIMAGMVAPAGFYVAIRILSLLSISTMVSNTLMILGVLTMLIGELVALTRKRLREILGFSSVAGMGTLLMAVLANASTGAIFHLLNLVLAKVVMFLSVEFLTSGGRDDLDSLKGVYRKNPVVAFTFAVGALSAAGLPFLAGFRSKLLILKDMVGSDHYLLTAFFIFASVVEFFYYTRIVQQVFSTNVGDEDAGRQCSHPIATVTLLAFVLLIIFLGIYPDPIVIAAERARGVLMDTGRYIAAVMGGI